jgi:hypothetical protein
VRPQGSAVTSRRLITKKKQPTDALFKALRSWGLKFPGAHTKSLRPGQDGPWRIDCRNSCSGSALVRIGHRLGVEVISSGGREAG